MFEGAGSGCLRDQGLGVGGTRGADRFSLFEGPGRHCWAVQRFWSGSGSWFGCLWDQGQSVWGTSVRMGGKTGGQPGFRSLREQVQSV